MTEPPTEESPRSPRRGRVPRKVAAAVPGHLLAAAPAGERWVAGTRTELVVLGREPDGSARVELRLPWDQVQSADWDADREQLEVREVGRFGQERATHRFALSAPRRLLELVRERVTASVVLQRRTVVGDRRGLTVLARRSPAGGELTWLCEYDEGVDPDDPRVARIARAALDRARAEVGESGMIGE